MGRATGPRKKRFTYADRLGRSQEEHARHWDGFSFEAGPVIVSAEGIWGGCQVWAASAEEGKRVIRHGLTFGGFDPDDKEQGEWKITTSRSGRNGQPGTYRTDVDKKGLRVSKRDGPNGQPFAEWPAAGPWG